MRTPQSERTPVAQQVFPKKTWSRKPPPKCACLLTFQEGVPSASRGLHDPTRRVGPSVPGQEGREVRMRRPSPPRLGGSAPRVCGSGSGLLSSLSLCSRLRGTRPQSPDPSGRPRGYPGARRFGALASQRRVASPGWARVLLLHGASGDSVGRPCALSTPDPLRNGTEPLRAPGSSNLPPRGRQAEPLPRRARLPAQGLPGREGARSSWSSAGLEAPCVVRRGSSFLFSFFLTLVLHV